MNIRSLALASLLTISPIMSWCSDWIPFGETDDAYWYVDKSSVVRSGKFRKAWFMTNSKSESALSFYPFSKYKSSKFLSYFICGERSASRIQSIYYSENFGSGNSVYSSGTTVEKAQFSEVIPDTMSESMLNYVCVISIYSK